MDAQRIYVGVRALGPMWLAYRVGRATGNAGLAGNIISLLHKASTLMPTARSYG